MDLPIILVVEDDQLIQSLIEETLSDGGFESAIVASGEEALTLLRGTQEQIPRARDRHKSQRQDGRLGSRPARPRDRPDFPVVYMSGAAAAEWTSKGVPHSIMLEKPFAPAQLLTAISNLLNAATPTT